MIVLRMVIYELHGTSYKHKCPKVIVVRDRSSRMTFDHRSLAHCSPPPHIGEMRTSDIIFYVPEVDEVCEGGDLALSDGVIISLMISTRFLGLRSNRA